MRKKIVSLLLAACLALGSIPGTAFTVWAAEVQQEEVAQTNEEENNLSAPGNDLIDEESEDSEIKGDAGDDQESGLDDSEEGSSAEENGEADDKEGFDDESGNDCPYEDEEDDDEADEIESGEMESSVPINSGEDTEDSVEKNGKNAEILQNEPEVIVEEYVGEILPSTIVTVSETALMQVLENGEFDWCYGNQLDGLAREVYDFLCDVYGDNANTGEQTLTFSEPVTFEAEISGSSIVANDSYNAATEKIRQAAQSGGDAFYYDHPETFWMKSYRFGYSISAGKEDENWIGKIEKLNFEPIEMVTGASSQARIAAFESGLTAAVDEIEGNLSAQAGRYDMAKEVHDYLCDKLTYDLNGEYAHSAGVAFGGDALAVCEGYAKAYKVLCDEMGIPCVLVSGWGITSSGQGEAHMWNYAQMKNGKWYLVDATWDDQTSRIYYNYFLAGASSSGFNGRKVGEDHVSDGDFSGAKIMNFAYPVLEETAWTQADEEIEEKPEEPAAFDAWSFSDPAMTDSFSYLAPFFTELQAQRLSELLERTKGTDFGMAASAAILNSSLQGPDDFGKETVNEITETDRSGALGISAISYIKYLHASQLWLDVCRAQQENENDLQGLYDAVKAYENGGESVLIRISGEYGGEGSRALWGVKVVEEGTESRILVYDSRHPGEERYLTLNKGADGNFISWSYPIAATAIWGSGKTYASLTYFTRAESLYQVLDEGLNENAGSAGSGISSNLLALGSGEMAENGLIPIRMTDITESGMEETVTPKLYWTQNNEVEIFAKEGSIDVELVTDDAAIGVCVSGGQDADSAALKCSAEEKTAEFNAAAGSSIFVSFTKAAGDGKRAVLSVEGIASGAAVSVAETESGFCAVGLNSIMIANENADGKRTETMLEVTDGSRVNISVGEDGNVSAGYEMVPVTIKVTQDQEKLTRVLEEFPAILDIRELFVLDENCGAAVYFVTGGTGNGTITQDGELTVTGEGTFWISVETAENGKYEAGKAAAELTIHKLPTFTVTFDTQGGSVIEPVAKIHEGTVIDRPADPKRKGYFFKGWYLNGALYDFSAPVTEDIVLTAVWEAIPEDYEGVLEPDIPTGGIPEGLWFAGVEDEVYTGKAIQPDIRVYSGSVRLKKGQDYTLSYRNNIKAADASAKTAPTIVVTGKGSYAGKVMTTFSILPKDIGDEDLNANDMLVKYNKRVQKPTPTVTWNGKKLMNRTDYTVTWPDAEEGAYREAGTWTILVKGKGNYTGERTVQLTVTASDLISSASVSRIPAQQYTGEKLEPMLTVKRGGKRLEEGKDYVVEYLDNVKIGTATAVITGKDGYAGEKRVTFRINGVAISRAKVSGLKTAFVYTGEEIRQSCELTITVGKDKKTLTENVDYTVSYEKNRNVGTAAVIFTGINGYSGTLKKTFKITAYDIAKDPNGIFEVQDGIEEEYVKDGSMPKPSITFRGEQLLENVDYRLNYKNHTAVNDGSNPKKMPTISIVGKGNFKGTRTVTFLIKSKDIGSLTLTAADKVFQNKKNGWKAAPVITDVNGKKLYAGRDYDRTPQYTYADRTELESGIVREAGEQVWTNDIPPVGTVICVTVKGIENYEGEVTGKYRIIKTDIKGASVTVPAQMYTGSEICPDRDEITVKIGKTELTSEDYEIVGYSNNINKGSGVIVLRGKGEYGGTKAVKFTIRTKELFWWWS